MPPFPVKVETEPTVEVDGGSLGIASQGRVYNVAMTNADTEYSFAIPDGSKGYELKSRNGGLLKLAFASGQSGSVYVEVPSGTSYDKGQLNTLGLALYFQSPQAAEVAQIIVYT